VLVKAYSYAHRPGFMSRTWLFSLLVLSVVVAPATAQYPEQACAVRNAYDFQSGIADADECSTLELQNSVALTANSFSSGTFVINNRNITIQASKAATNAPITFDFGTYALDGKISATGTSTVTFTDLAVQNYAASSVQNGSISTFMTLFSCDSTSALHTSNVQFLVDAGRCLLDSNYTNELATPRISWSVSSKFSSYAN
jgi:hypothetical protein